MNAPAPAPRRSRLRRTFRWLAVTLAAGLLLLVIGVANVLTLTRDASALRDELLEPGRARAHTRVQLSAGPVLLGLVRTGLSFVPDLDPDARLALAAVGRASVGVYEWREKWPDSARSELMANADTAMAGRGWRRAVAVSDGATLVLIYLPEKGDAGSRQRVCLAVCDQKQLVVVAGLVDPAALAKLAVRHRGVLPLSRAESRESGAG